MVWLVFFFVVPFFIQISHALLFFRGHSGPGYRDNEGRGSGSAGLLAAAPVEPELLASSGLLLWGGCRAATMPAEEPPPSFDLGLQSQLLTAVTGLGVDAGAGEEAAACASVEELLRASSGLLNGPTRAQAEGRWRVRRRGRDGAASGPRPAPRRQRPRWPRPSPGRVEADTDGRGDAPPNHELHRGVASSPCRECRATAAGRPAGGDAHPAALRTRARLPRP